MIHEPLRAFCFLDALLQQITEGSWLGTASDGRFDAKVSGVTPAPLASVQPPPVNEQQREKLLQAIAFFVKATRDCHKLKLFKLLFLFDFEVFRQTGKSPTGLRYFAWPMGPVPKALFEELSKPSKDLAQRFRISKSEPDNEGFGGNRLDLTPKREVDLDAFTRREVRALEKLAEIYRDARGKDMVAVTHERNSPWFRVYELEKRVQEEIPYELALDGAKGSISVERARQIAEEADELARFANGGRR